MVQGQECAYRWREGPGRCGVTEEWEGEKGPVVNVGWIRVDGDVCRPKGSLGKIVNFFFLEKEDNSTLQYKKMMHVWKFRADHAGRCMVQTHHFSGVSF